ncbi:MAG TPA: hypothetical protein VMV72_00195 [Verrucomicrobiae bacterium]|nr:hypothetical protein [Verrucomicrobiae bacterium]
MSRCATIAILITCLALACGCECLSSNNNAYRDILGPDINEVNGQEMPPGYGLIRE